MSHVYKGSYGPQLKDQCELSCLLQHGPPCPSLADAGDSPKGLVPSDTELDEAFYLDGPACPYMADAGDPGSLRDRSHLRVFDENMPNWCSAPAQTQYLCLSSRAVMSRSGLTISSL